MAKKILYCEDEADLWELARRALTRRGYACVWAATGAAGIALAAAEAPDLLLLDFDLGDMTGAEVARQVRAAGNPAPLIVLSGRYQADVASEFAATPPVEILRKPIDVADLTAAVARVLGGPA